MNEYCPRLPMNHTLLARVCREDKEAKMSEMTLKYRINEERHTDRTCVSFYL